ncbi:MAG: peptidoglycan bridge formation glycyltransferase FemA/FemB family protein [Hyphomicrobiales bacterium]|nr:peptidoglycan bridge formation glycyltransferase FemA/FemB family protein [Hyphomicrobiales bacterium]
MPAHWKLLTEDEARAVWNSNATRFHDCSPFQTFEWGRYQKALGWQPVHYAALSQDGTIGAMCLALLRLPTRRTGFLWCVGGPIGDVAVWNDLPNTVMATQELKHLYFRFRCDRDRDSRDMLLLQRRGWRPAYSAMGPNLSMNLELTAEPEVLLANFSRHWRLSLRKGLRHDLLIRQTDSPDIDRVRAVFAEMEANKNLPELFSREKLESLFRHAGSSLIFLQCEDRNGTLLALRGTLIVGDRACDYLAATSSQGRRLRASYPLLWEMIRRCRAKGVRHFDLGGIDPVGNPGVYAFKRQTGAREVELLGEWDWASSPLLRRLGNWIVREKDAIRRFSPWVRCRLGLVWPPAAMKWFNDSLIYCSAIG